MAAVVSSGAIAYYRISQISSPPQLPKPAHTVSAPQQIVALGQLEQQQEVKVNYPALTAEWYSAG